METFEKAGRQLLVKCRQHIRVFSTISKYWHRNEVSYFTYLRISGYLITSSKQKAAHEDGKAQPLQKFRGVILTKNTTHFKKTFSKYSQKSLIERNYQNVIALFLNNPVYWICDSTRQARCWTKDAASIYTCLPLSVQVNWDRVCLSVCPMCVTRPVRRS